jgi:hypothetical protein
LIGQAVNPHGPQSPGGDEMSYNGWSNYETWNVLLPMIRAAIRAAKGESSG